MCLKNVFFYDFLLKQARFSGFECIFVHLSYCN